MYRKVQHNKNTKERPEVVTPLRTAILPFSGALKINFNKASILQLEENERESQKQDTHERIEKNPNITKLNTSHPEKVLVLQNEMETFYKTSSLEFGEIVNWNRALNVFRKVKG